MWPRCYLDAGRQRPSAEQDFTLWPITFDEPVLLLANLRKAVYLPVPMNSIRPSFAKFQVQDPNAAIARNKNYDALSLTLRPSEWAPLNGYLQPFTLAQDQDRPSNEHNPIGEMHAIHTP